MKRYEITLTGETPLLHHYDNLAFDAVMKQWTLDPANKKNSVAGDDRTPPFRWIGYLYRYGDVVTLPSDNLMTMFREGGMKCPTGRGQQTFKALTQSGIVVDQAQWTLTTRKGAAYSVAGIDDLVKVEDFDDHLAWAKERGFELFVKRAKIGNSKHVRVRPRFDDWAATGTITVLESKITKDVLTNILTFAGCYSGLCDWRPSSPKSPGSFGRFTATIKTV